MAWKLWCRLFVLALTDGSTSLRTNKKTNTTKDGQIDERWGFLFNFETTRYVLSLILALKYTIEFSLRGMGVQTDKQLKEIILESTKGHRQACIRVRHKLLL